MNKSVYLGLLVAGLSSSIAFAQDASQAPPEEVPAEEVPAEEVPAEETAEEPVEEEAVEEEPVEEEPVEEEAVEEEAVEEPAEESFESAFGNSPIADLATEEFEPLEDIEEGVLATIIPAKVYPRIEWNGAFRFRSLIGVNWDLDTEGTSASAPALESYVPAASPDSDRRTIARSDKQALWSSNMRLRLEPTIHITDELGVHLEVDMLRNVQFGSMPMSHPYAVLTSGDQLSPRETEWFQNAIQVYEAYGYADTLLGNLRVGRMDDHWGLGMWINDGDCDDCDFGNTVDRFEYSGSMFGLHATLSVDFPNEGVSTRSSQDLLNQAFDAAQIDDADQYTVSIFKGAKTREERELEQRRLLEEGAVVLGGGLLYRYRTQEGQFDSTPAGLNPEAPPGLIYLGSSQHIFDLVGELKWQPTYDKSAHVKIEALIGFGQVDNTSGLSVGGDTEPSAGDAINCFDESTRLANPDRCLSGQTDILQFGAAMESEFHFGGPVRFGVDAGFASGGDTENWGYAGDDSKFFRFNPDYNVDLILFERVIGTVTNAAYYRPHISARFLESGGRYLELDFAGVFSHALEVDATPGQDRFLGLEFDAGLSYNLVETFSAGLEGGILFPFQGLAAREDARRLLPIGGTFFDQSVDPGIAWTVQSKFFWSF